MRQHSPAAHNSWAQGLPQHRQQSAARPDQTASPAPLAFQPRSPYGLHGFQSAFAPPISVQQPAQESKGKAPAYEQFDEAAFERAFAQAADDAMLAVAQEEAAMEDQQQQALEAVLEEQQRDLEREMKLELHNAVKLEEMAPLSRLEEYSAQQAVEQQPQEPDARQEEDALAATAQELLEKVRDNQTDKFRNSHFLGLMRKLRDREVKVEGDKMVETVSAPQHLHPTSSPHDSSYASGESTPRSVDHYHFDTHTCSTPGCNADHAYDHWESPFR